MNEVKALHALQGRDARALEWFIDRYTPYVSAIIRRIIGDTMPLTDVEEVASDVFLAFWGSAEKVRVECIKGYLGSLARNKAKNRRRALGNELPLDDDIILISNETPEYIFEKKEQERMVYQAVLSMEETDKEIFLRFYYYYQPTAQIAQELSMNEATVKTRLRRGRETLKNVLLKDGIVEGGCKIGAKNI